MVVVQFDRSSGRNSNSSDEAPTWGNSQVGLYQRVSKGTDRCTVRRCTIGGERIQLSLLLDGHGGTEAADHCKLMLLDSFILACDGDPSVASMKSACSSAFQTAHRQVRTMQGSTSGCTAVLVVINEDRWACVCANVGDSNAMLVRDTQDSKPTPQFQMLCENHRLSDNLAEQQRIIAAGYNVGRAVNKGDRGKPKGPLRAYPGGLIFSRAIGNADCADWLLAEPHVSVTLLQPESKCLVVVASNGVWDVLDPALAAVLARRAKDVHTVAAALVQRATNDRNPYYTSEWNVPLDDTTAIALSIGPSARPTTLVEAERKKRQVWTIRLAMPSSAKPSSKANDIKWPSSTSRSNTECGESSTNDCAESSASTVRRAARF
uniref:PPM-type phosphatase domain-containing protein n=1 Tax=Chrysotila carterae TaxID=13221 RepID=A0A7S4FBY0_CHRCT|mmetsp:Transcript_45023/g.97897  ORF Transcript_45023/g.97897 Transcript_45023/m.97897 type:complete len:377 (+) Transcript_45023:194-1324(+)